jgi:hypothetical protein
MKYFYLILHSQNIANLITDFKLLKKNTLDLISDLKQNSIATEVRTQYLSLVQVNTSRLIIIIKSFSFFKFLL